MEDILKLPVGASQLPLPFWAWASSEGPPPGYQCLFVTIATSLPLQKSMPAEEAHFINTKQLKFLLARSRWQVSPLFPGKRC